MNRPIYVPADDTAAIALLTKGDVANVVALLKLRISLGSDPAAALLGYLEYMGAVSGVSNPRAAIDLCAASAKRGHGYARYVLSWAHWEIGERTDALRWMKSSAVDSKFLPAWIELGVMLAMLGVNRKEVRAGVTYVWVAHKLGHSAALLNICAIGLGGRLGLAWRLGSALAFPFCLLRAMIFWSCNPFSERSLVTAKNPRIPLLTPGASS